VIKRKRNLDNVKMATLADYYAWLSIPREASSMDVKKAFRKLSLKFHPDADSRYV